MGVVTADVAEEAVGILGSSRRPLLVFLAGGGVVAVAVVVAELPVVSADDVVGVVTTAWRGSERSRLRDLLSSDPVLCPLRCRLELRERAV